MHRMTSVAAADGLQTRVSPAEAWLRALELTAPIPRHPDRLLANVIDEVAARFGDRSALLSETQCMTYSDLAARSHQYARWALSQGFPKGHVIGLLMENSPEYFAAWLGITSVGCIVALLNTNLKGQSLEHCIQVVGARHLIAGAECISAVETLPSPQIQDMSIWMHGRADSTFTSLEDHLALHSIAPLMNDERRHTTIHDTALYIFTSGTTGMPKAARLSHARVIQWSCWFAGMMSVASDDRMYNCLPMYHSVGGVLVPGAMLVAGASVVVRARFSASQFWSDVARWDCTLIQYIGELCRYLLHANLPRENFRHRIRMACGNGMAAEVWDEFKERFQIPRIFEFYAATEGGISLFNIEGKRGAIGHVPAYLQHRFSPMLIVHDNETGEPVRNEAGFCVRCAPNMTGEAIGKVVDDLSGIGSRFDGYTDVQATERKILRNVFVQGDAWVRTGDLMRKDEKGFFYFVDRVGDTFRWKGENVSTSEVAEAICSFAGVRHANVYGVSVPGCDGRVGMASVVADPTLDLPLLREHLADRLPSYARPSFLRLASEIQSTATFKYSKSDLVRQGYNPAATSDQVYFDCPEFQSYVSVDKSLYERIQSGDIRL
jgi:fatty-acyl-CoA synthase